MRYFFEKEQKRQFARLQCPLHGFIDQLESCISLSQRLEPLLGLMRFSLFFNWFGTRGFTTRTEVYFGKSFDEHMFLRRDDAFRKIYFQLDGIANELDEPRLKKS